MIARILSSNNTRIHSLCIEPTSIFSCCTNQVSKNLLEVARLSLISRLRDLMETGLVRSLMWSVVKGREFKIPCLCHYVAGNSSSCLHQRRHDGTDWLDLPLPNTTHTAGIRRVPFPSNPTTIWYLHKRLKFLLLHFPLCPPQLILRTNEIAAIIWEDCLYIPSTSNQAPQCKYEWISVKGMSNLNVYCSTTHAKEHCSAMLDLTPPVLLWKG